MKRYKHTWFNGMIEVPNGEYVKEKEAAKMLDYRILECNELHTKYTDLRICSLLLTAGLMFSVFFNIFQFLIK